MKSSFILLANIFGTIVFCVAGSSVGTGFGFIIRGQINYKPISYIVIGLFVMAVLYGLNKAAVKKLHNNFGKSLKLGSRIGAFIFVVLFVYFVVLGNM